MRLLVSFFILWLLIGCKEKKGPDLSGKTPLKPNQLIKVYRKLVTPFSVSDTNLLKVADTTTIGIAALKQFVPDSIINNLLSKAKKPIAHAVGILEKDQEYYLLTLLQDGKAAWLVVFLFDKKNKFIDAKPLISNIGQNGYLHTALINAEPTFTTAQEKLSNNQLFYTRTGYAYNAEANRFITVITESNETIAAKTALVINPIDTLPKTMKLSGDYVRDSKNFMSVRDGVKANTYRIFIHFEKNNGNCTGELKGEITMKDATKAIYTQSGDPCIIDFSFNPYEVKIKEQGSCGNRRGIKCFFNDVYPRKKVSKKKK
jgi:hypothetical protein